MKLKCSKCQGDVKTMKWRKKCGIFLSVVLFLTCLCINANANEITDTEYNNVIVNRATGRFSMDVPAGTLRQSSTSFPLDPGETVTIKASYSPFSANVDFGLITPDGWFYHFTETDGSVDKSIKITQRGNYTFAVRNNSSYEISVTGFVNY